MATQITRKSEKSSNKNALVGLLVFAAIVALGSIAIFKQAEKADEVIIDQSVLLTDKKTVSELLSTNATLSKFTGSLNKAGIGYLPEKTYTVFAPTNEAFSKIDVDTMGTLEEPANVEQLKSVLNYHIVEGKFAFKDFTDADRTAEQVHEGGDFGFAGLHGIARRFKAPEFPGIGSGISTRSRK